MGTPPSRLWLGVQGENAEKGAKLTAITPESPAAKAGLKANDIVATADGQPVKDYAALTNLLRSHKEGDRLALQVLRDGKTVDMAVTLEERPLGRRIGHLKGALDVSAPRTGWQRRIRERN